MHAHYPLPIPPSADVALVESSALRAQHIDRIDVLDKVKALRLLPDGVHMTTDLVAGYYEVPVETLKSTVKYHRDELTNAGYRVMEGAEFARLKSDLAITNPMTRSLALFTRRAVLNVGMLLRDSPVAKQVRTYLLDAESSTVDLSDPLDALDRLNTHLGKAIAVAKAERARAELAEARAESGERFKRAIEAGDGLTPRSFHKKYFSAITEKVFSQHLYGHGYLIDQRGKGPWDDKRGRRRDGRQHRHPTAKGKEFFYLHGAVGADGKRHESIHIRPGHVELALRDRLAAEGLTPNEQPSLFALEAA